MESIQEYLSYLDIFGYDLSFRHNRFTKYRTYYGGILTIFCTGFLVYAFMNLARDCLDKTNPTVRETSYYDDYSIVNGTKFFFGFYFTDDKFKAFPNPEKYLIFQGVLTNYTNDAETKTINFVKCDYERHFERTKLPLSRINEKIKNFNDTWCLDLDEDFKLINSGTEIPRLSLSIYVIECTNSSISEFSNTDKCASKTEIDMKLKSFVINSYFFNSYIVTDDIQNPNKVNIKQESLGVNNFHACDKLFITYKHSIVSMDDGFIFQSPNVLENIKISNYVPDQVPNTQQNLGYSVIYNVEIDADHFRSVTYVRFQKIQEALATMGGIISIMKLLFTLILMGIYRFSFPLVLFREVYLQGQDKIKLDRNTNQQNLINLENIKIHNKNLDKNNNFQCTNAKPKNFLNLRKLDTIKKSNIANENQNTNNDAKCINVVNENFKVIKLNNRKNNIFGNEDRKNDNNDTPNNLKTELNLIKGKSTGYSQSQNNIETNFNFKDGCQTFNEFPNANGDKKNYFDEGVYQDLNKNYNISEKENNENIRSSKRKLTTLTSADVAYPKNLDKEKKNNEDEEDNSNNKIILSDANKAFEQLNCKKNPIHILASNLKRKNKASDPNSIYEKQTNKLTDCNPISPKSNRKVDKTNNINKRNKYKFSINFPNLVYSICCRKKHIYEPLNIILEKIDKEIEIKSYLRIKEDFLIMKELLFDPQDREIFNNPYDFEEIYYSVKNTIVNEKEGKNVASFWKRSFTKENNLFKKSNTRVPKEVSRFSEKFKSLGEQLKKFIK